MNLKRGFFRSLIAAIALWSGFWGWAYYDATQKAESYHGAVLEWAKMEREDQSKDPKPSKSDREWLKNQIEETVQLRNEQRDRADHGRSYLWKGIIAIVAVWVAIAWTYLGFRE